MTTYYYIASDIELKDGNASLEFIETEEWSIPGLDYPVQREIMNGVEKQWELRELLQYLRNHAESQAVCTFQIIHLLNPSGLAIQSTSTIHFHELIDPKQLLLDEGELLTIKKV